jgi:hypothetical protein
MHFCPIECESELFDGHQCHCIFSNSFTPSHGMTKLFFKKYYFTRTHRQPFAECIKNSIQCVCNENGPRMKKMHLKYAVFVVIRFIYSVSFYKKFTLFYIKNAFFHYKQCFQFFFSLQCAYMQAQECMKN